VDGVDELRRTWPRRVTVRRRDGTVETLDGSGPVAEMLRRLADLDPADVEIAPASLDEVFRAVVARAGP
jgi:hypothetical protein